MATRIGRYQRGRKSQGTRDLQSTLQLQEKLSLLSYHPPGAHVANRIRCNTRGHSHCAPRRIIRPERVTSQNEIQLKEELINIDTSAAQMRVSERQDVGHLDSICVSTRGARNEVCAPMNNTLATNISMTGSDKKD